MNSSSQDKNYTSILRVGITRYPLTSSLSSAFGEFSVIGALVDTLSSYRNLSTILPALRSRKRWVRTSSRLHETAETRVVVKRRAFTIFRITWGNDLCQTWWGDMILHGGQYCWILCLSSADLSAIELRCSISDAFTNFKQVFYGCIYAYSDPHMPST